MTAPARLTLVENQEEPGVLRQLATALGRDDTAALMAVNQLNGRLRQLLRADRAPVAVNAYGAVRAQGLAGLLHLAPSVELEVVPKFLNVKDPSWCEDFFVLALFSATGRVLPREQVLAATGARGDLATLVARAMIEMYWESHRRPLRAYLRTPVADFSWDGEVDAVSLLLPDADGFLQSAIRLERSNSANAVISSAAVALLPEVRDGETCALLMRLHAALAPQRTLSRGKQVSLPSRHQRWQPLYDLSLQVLGGFGLTFDPQKLLAPGYVMRTWTTWQALCESLLRTGLPGTRVSAQPQYLLGQRDGSALFVTPDFAFGDKHAPSALADAKYGAKVGRSATIDACDVYESLAFMQASGTDQLVLLYPRPADDGPALPVGTTAAFQKITVGSRSIRALEVECRGIAGKDGYSQMARRVGQAVKSELGL